MAEMTVRSVATEYMVTALPELREIDDAARDGAP